MLPAPLHRAWLGLALATGAPLGWLLVQASRGHSPWVVAQADPWLIAYLTVATAIAFTAFGWSLGRVEARLRARNELLLSVAETDTLTGLVNRRGVESRQRGLVATAQRTARPLSAVLFDLDHFKQLNDTHGHLIGDAVLASLGRLWRVHLRANDVLARVGGEEFLLFLPGADLQQARQVAERMVGAVRDRQIVTASGPLHVTVSAGVTQWRAGESAQAWLARTDSAMYRAKAEGRDRVADDGAESC